MEYFRNTVPEPARFVVSGAVGSAAFWVLNEAAMGLLPEDLPHQITIGFFSSYLVSIWLQHLLHATLVYGWDTPYWQGLIACCELPQTFTTSHAPLLIACCVEPDS